MKVKDLYSLWDGNSSSVSASVPLSQESEVMTLITACDRSQWEPRSPQARPELYVLFLVLKTWWSVKNFGPQVDYWFNNNENTVNNYNWQNQHWINQPINQLITDCVNITVLLYFFVWIQYTVILVCECSV